MGIKCVRPPLNEICFFDDLKKPSRGTCIQRKADRDLFKDIPE